MMSHMYTTKVLLVILGYFTEPGAMQFIVQPGDITLALNQMSDATFNCSCPDCNPEPPPYWTLEIDGDHFDISDPHDRQRLDLRGISFNRSGLPVVISIPDRIENNNTVVMCAAFLGGVEFSDPVKVIIIGPPLPPKPALVINSSSQLDIKWEPPYSHVDYPVVSYNIQIVNVSSGGILEMAELQSNETSHVYSFDDDVRYCQNLTVNVTAVSALGSSEPGLVSRGFPIVPLSFELDIDDVKVTFLRNGTPMASISFEAPVICDYQTANYTLTVEDISDPGVNLKPIESSYTGRNRYIMGVIASGLKIDHNYTLHISVVESHFKLERSQSINFTTVFQSRNTGTSSGHLPRNLGIYIGVPIAVLLFLLLAAIIIVVILVCSIVRKRKEWRVARGGSGVRASSPASVYETINDYQTHQEHHQHGGASQPRNDDSSYQEMMSSAATEGIRVTTGGATFIYPSYTAANQQNAISRPGNPYIQQPCPAAAGSSASPVFGHTVTVTGQPSPMMVVLQDRVGAGGVFVEDDDQDYTAMSQAGTLISQQSSRTVTEAQQQDHSASGADGNAALPMYSVVNKGEPSKSQNFMVTEC